MARLSRRTRIAGVGCSPVDEKTRRCPNDERIAVWSAVVMRSTCRSSLVQRQRYGHSVRLNRSASRLPHRGHFSGNAVLQPSHQGGLEQHFRSVASATALPVVLYEHSGSPGRKICDRHGAASRDDVTILSPQRPSEIRTPRHACWPKYLMIRVLQR